MLSISPKGDPQCERQTTASSETSTSQSMAPLKSMQRFPRFLELPKEIQIMIWETAADEPQLIQFSERLANDTEILVKTSHESPLLNTCKLARDIALKVHSEFQVLMRRTERSCYCHSCSVRMSLDTFERPIPPHQLFSMRYNISRDVLYFSGASEFFRFRSEYGLESSSSRDLSRSERVLKGLNGGARRLAFGAMLHRAAYKSSWGETKTVYFFIGREINYRRFVGAHHFELFLELEELILIRPSWDELRNIARDKLAFGGRHGFWDILTHPDRVKKDLKRMIKLLTGEIKQVYHSVRVLTQGDLQPPSMSEWSRDPKISLMSEDHFMAKYPATRLLTDPFKKTELMSIYANN